MLSFACLSEWSRVSRQGATLYCFNERCTIIACITSVLPTVLCLVYATLSERSRGNTIGLCLVLKYVGRHMPIVNMFSNPLMTARRRVRARNSE